MPGRWLSLSVAVLASPRRMDPEQKARLVPLFNQGFASAVPHNAALRLAFEDLGPGEVLIRLPYDEKLIGNPETGVLHGGAITALIDASCGASVFVKMGSPIAIATLDLRIDYLRPAEPPKDVLCRATCAKVTNNVAFVHAIAFHAGDEADPIASSAGTFILFRSGGKSAMSEPRARALSDAAATPEEPK